MLGAVLLAMPTVTAPVEADHHDDDEQPGSHIHKGGCRSLVDAAKEIDDPELDHRDDNGNGRRDRDRVWQLNGDDPRLDRL